MNYAEVTPSKQLSRFVKCFWTLEVPRTAEPSAPEPVMPDGSLEIIFNLADPFRRFHDDGSIETQPLAIVAGQMHTRAVIAPSGSVKLFGIRFWPAGAYPFFRFPLHELTDRLIDLGQVWPHGFRELEERIGEATTLVAQVAAAERSLSKLLSTSRQLDDSVESAAAMIGGHRGRIKMDQVAAEMNLPGRTLERRFRERLGVSPKFFSRIVRFQFLLNSVRECGATDLLGTALTAGYYDQAHLIREFKEFSGRTPGEFFAQEHDLSDVFIAA